MSDDLCSAFNLRTAKYLSNDCKVSKDSTLRWFPEEATKVIKIYYALFNGSALASPKAASDYTFQFQLIEYYFITLNIVVLWF